MNKQLFLMMGAPGSGKSTWIKKQLKEDDAYISRDEIRFSMLKIDDDYFAKENEVYDFFTRTIAAELMSSKHQRVFADASHLNEGSRIKLLATIEAILNTTYDDASLDDIEIAVIWMKTTLETCINRNGFRTGRQHVPVDTVTNMWKSQRMPKASEGIDRVYIVNEKEQEIDIVELNATDKNNFIF